MLVPPRVDRVDVRPRESSPRASSRGSLVAPSPRAVALRLACRRAISTASASSSPSRPAPMSRRTTPRASSRVVASPALESTPSIDRRATTSDDDSRVEWIRAAPPPALPRATGSATAVRFARDRRDASSRTRLQRARRRRRERASRERSVRRRVTERARDDDDDDARARRMVVARDRVDVRRERGVSRARGGGGVERGDVRDGILFRLGRGPVRTRPAERDSRTRWRLNIRSIDVPTRRTESKDW